MKRNRKDQQERLENVESHRKGEKLSVSDYSSLPQSAFEVLAQELQESDDPIRPAVAEIDSNATSKKRLIDTEDRKEFSSDRSLVMDQTRVIESTFASPAAREFACFL